MSEGCVGGLARPVLARSARPTASRRCSSGRSSFGPALGRSRGGVPRRAPEPSACSSAGAGAARLLVALRGAPLVVAEEAGEEEAARALRMGRADVVVSAPADSAAPVEYRLDLRVRSGHRPGPRGRRGAAGGGPSRPVRSREIALSEPGGRYVDFLVPGLSHEPHERGHVGSGLRARDMRIKKLLKRLLATPMRAADFMLALMATRAVSTFVEVAALLGFARLGWGPVRARCLGRGGGPARSDVLRRPGPGRRVRAGRSRR